MDINDVYGIMDRFDCSGYGELKLEMNGVRLELKKAGASITCGNSAADNSDAVHMVTIQREAVKNAIEEQPQAEQAGKVIKAPLVGTFYTAAGPDDEPFVKIGQSIHAGDVIGIIEAMKLMNEVTADCDGVVKEVAAENGAMIEYGQPLVILN